MNVFVLLEFVFELKKFLRGFDESYGGKILVVCSFSEENNYEVLFEDKGLFDGWGVSSTVSVCRFVNRT